MTVIIIANDYTVAVIDNVFVQGKKKTNLPKSLSILLCGNNKYDEY